MKRLIYLICVWTMVWSLAACGKAISSYSQISEDEEKHTGFVDEEETIEIERSKEITVRTDKINIGFAQSSNFYEWQVAQTESFYSAFTESDGYHLNIQDAHGDAKRQKEQLNALIDAPVDVLFIVPADSECIAGEEERARDLGIRVFVVSPEEDEALNGVEARRRLETETDIWTEQIDKKR